MKPVIDWKETGVWNFTAAPAAGRGKRSRRAHGVPEISDALRSALKDAGVEIIAERIAQVDEKRAARRGPPVEGAGRLPVPDVETDAGERVALLLQHASGAIQIKLPADSTSAGVRRGARGTRGAKRVRHRFDVVLTQHDDEEDDETGTRRGARSWLKKAIKIVLVKVVEKLAQKAVPWLVARWEKSSWEKAQRPLGWLQVAASDKGLKLKSITPTASVLGTGRRLLFIHGTFSNTAGAFGDLTGSAFFKWAATQYGDRIFAFNHFTMSEKPEENALALLSALPSSGGPWEFDVITHSRGGLVLRSLVELRLKNSARFQPGRIVLTASPNAGTPLVTPGRWDEVLSFWANLGDLFPNVLTDAVSWVADALTWIAGRVGDDIPGLASMNMYGPQIAALQEAPAPSSGEWSALVANFQPDRTFWLRFADAGLDRFFDGANDIVVPTEAGWFVDHDLRTIPAERTGCFGSGGNLLRDDPGQVNHLNFFSRPESVTFLQNALSGQPHNLPVIDQSAPLPARTGRRGKASGVAPVRALPVTAAPLPPQPALLPQPAQQSSLAALTLRPMEDPDTLSIIIMGGSREREQLLEDDDVPAPRGRAKEQSVPPKLLASFGNAHVLIDFPVRNADDSSGSNVGNLFSSIIKTTWGIRDYCNGVEGSSIPENPELLEYGHTLFRLLLRPELLRLYDLARSRRAGRPLYVTFTSQIPWIADKPWEFIFDPTAGGSGRMEHGGSGSFLATGEVIFTRNVLTPRPSALPPRDGPLRILVVAAQPLDAVKLSIDEERELLRRGFEDLAAAGLAVIKVLPRATPELLQKAVAVEPFDIVHIISHGVFDGETESGAILFENERGEEYALPQEEVCLLLSHRGIRLIFLNACETGVVGKRRFNSGLTSALVESGIPAVVGNQFSVDDLSATVFAQHFYWHLGHGLTVGEAAREARVAVRCFLPEQVLDWAVPVVYAGDPHLRLCSRFGSPAVLESPAVTAARAMAPALRRSASAQQLRVAVWDVAYTLPRLKPALERLNFVQNLFHFDVVDGSVPMGLKMRNMAARKDAGPLDVIEADRRLKHMPRHLGMDLLACIVDQPLDDGECANLYAYTNVDEKGSSSRVAFYSVTEFKSKRSASDNPSVRAENDRREDRAVAMLAATAVCWNLSNLGTHEGGSKNCPMYYDAEIEMAFLSERPRFCAACRRKFKLKNARNAMPDEHAVLDALDGMLGAFF